jgi:hypothetical protein
MLKKGFNSTVTLQKRENIKKAEI